MQFLHFPDRPAELDSGFLETAFGRLCSRIDEAEAADGPQPWLALYHDWNELRAYVSGERARRYYRLTKDMNDGAAEASEKQFREEFLPIAENAGSRLIEALVASRHRGAVAEKYGEHLIDVLEVSRQPLDPVNSELRVKAGALVKEYDKLGAGGEVVVRGETKTLAQAGAMTTSEDAALRKEAFLAHRGWFLANRDELARIFDELVRLRDEMGRNLGHDDYVPLGYASMERTDYGPEEAARFRGGVREHAVPLLAEIHAWHARALGKPALEPWDMGYHPELTLPSGVAEPIGEQLDKAQAVFSRLSPRLAAHFTRMRQEDLIDLPNRKGKAAGAYCTMMEDEGRVAIFCNSVGDQSDVSTLMHEMGHAFQGWESQWIEATPLRCPTADACEIHSMGMEYLSMPYLGEYFGAADLEKFSRNRYRQSVTLLCYCCLVDEFQHRVYAEPGMSPDRRDEVWNELSDAYLPGIDWGGRGDLEAARWYVQLHIFRYPFYYIDYAIAETGALQLALMDADDHERAMETYLELCHIGGTRSVLGIFEGAGMRSPFDPDLMRDLMGHARRQLGL
ncbi:MAG: M3 family oligoendopeptidase [Planctomycetota bacterium]